MIARSIVRSVAFPKRCFISFGVVCFANQYSWHAVHMHISFTAMIIKCCLWRSLGKHIETRQYITIQCSGPWLLWILAVGILLLRRLQKQNRSADVGAPWVVFEYYLVVTLSPDFLQTWSVQGDDTSCWRSKLLYHQKGQAHVYYPPTLEACWINQIGQQIYPL